LVIGLINHLKVVTKNNYNTIADLQNLQSLHNNLLSLFPLVFTIRFLATDLEHRNCKTLAKLHTPNIAILQHM
jgi:hypothetical protein